MPYTPGVAIINGIKYRPYVNGKKYTFPYYKEYDEHTLLLLRGDSLEDNSIYKVPIINNGVVVSSDQSKFGNGSMYFDGSSYLTISASDIGLDFNADWTIDWWGNASKKNGSACAVFYMQNANNGFVCYSNSGNSVRLFAGDSGWTFVPVTVIGTEVVGTWTHRAVVKSGSTIRCFENGVLTAEIPVSGSITMKESFLIGFRNTPRYSGGYFGYIEEFRVSDIARWTSNFTPPIEPYSS